eukprot:6486948-Amphidinium_carterae.1
MESLSEPQKPRAFGMQLLCQRKRLAARTECAALHSRLETCAELQGAALTHHWRAKKHTQACSSSNSKANQAINETMACNVTNARSCAIARDAYGGTGEVISTMAFMQRVGPCEGEEKKLHVGQAADRSVLCALHQWLAGCSRAEEHVTISGDSGAVPDVIRDTPHSSIDSPSLYPPPSTLSTQK